MYGAMSRWWSGKPSWVESMETQLDNSKQKYENIKLLLKEIQELNNAYDRSNEKVQNKADELRQVLCIQPNDWWKNFNQTEVNEMIAGMSVDLTKLGHFLSAERDFNIDHVLDNTSDGLALCGILLTDDEGDFLQCRKKLLSASTCQPRITTPDKCQEETLEVVHYSRKDFDEFNKTLHISGFNIASKLKARNSEEDAATERDTCETVGDVHYSKTMCMLVPTGEVNLKGTGSLRLSARALEDLQGIGRSVAEGADKELNSKLIEFLKMYGSHVGLDFVMGGIFRVSVVYSGPERLACQQTTEDEVDDIYNAIVSASYVARLSPVLIDGSLNEEKIKRLGLCGTYDPSALAKISLQVERIGGSRYVESIPFWKASLGLGSDVCSVVVNEQPSLRAIWDLLPEINPKEIHRPQQVADHLLQAWPAAGSQITQLLESNKEEPVAGPTSNPPGTDTPGEASVPSLAAGSPIRQALESEKKEPMASPTSDPPGSGTPGEASPSSPAAGPPIQQAFMSEEKKPMASPISNPLVTGTPLEASVPSPAAGPECKGKNADTFRKVLSLLCLEEYYPQKISLKCVVSITEGREEKDKLALPDIPWIILRKLLMINYEGRNTDWEGKLSVPDQGGPSDEDDLLGSSLADIHADLQDNDIPHPTDIFLATFSCCDLMLRQVLLEKMTMCRLSVPLVMPGLMGTNPTVCKWALRSVVLEYRKNKSKTSPGSMVEFALVDCPMKVVSFVRIGEIPISKSQLLNNFLSAQSHHTFFNKETCSMGTSDRSISNGMIEAAWYLPHDAGLIDDVTMFLNLRGDAANLPQQARLISTISSVVIVFVEIKDLDGESAVSAIRTLYQSQLEFVLVLTGTATDTEGFVQSYGEKVGEEIKSATTKPITAAIHGKKQKTLAALKREIFLNLSTSIKKGSIKTYDELSHLVMQFNDNICIDENDEECQQGKALADKVTCHIKNTPVAEIKKEQLPIQQLYPKWSRSLKEQNRSRCKNRETTLFEESERLHQEMKVLREKQFNIGLTPMMQNFTSTLFKLINAPTKLQFFLQWLKLCFDKISRDHLPKLRNEYRQCSAAFNAMKGTTSQGLSARGTLGDQQLPDLSKLKNKMDDAEKTLTEASCGLEHLFREVGQLYEASKESKHTSNSCLGPFRTKSSDLLPPESLLPPSTELELDTVPINQIVDKLPDVAARLLFLGHPIELVDGDAANVPMTWVKAVLASLDALIGESHTSAKHAKPRSKRVFVLSVLGIQSTGKSTLLNTMFGMRFAVSAGRCTRGVFAQLVEVDASTTELPFDYILVVDTQGLKSLALSHDKFEHDNELATLTVGLGDVVILNIKGGNVSEMQDVLQIVVYAFLRMKRVKLEQACVFIHQNVSATDADEKLAPERQKLLHNLDEMTEQAAKQEELTDIHSFNQIIQLGADKFVWYFSDLWLGDPPMAPVNPGYSKSVENVRKSLLFGNKKKDFLSVQHLSTRINDLWQGILADDFVFSFRNTLAVKAYSALEDKYNEVTWEIESSVSKWFSDTAQHKLERCEVVDSLDMAKSDLINELETKMDDLNRKQRVKLEEFFEEDNLKQITIQWKEEKVHSLLSLARYIVEKTKDDINQKTDHLLFEIRNREKQIDLDNQIQAKARELAEVIIRNKQTDEMLPTQFNEMWEKWVASLAPPKERKETPIQAELEQAIREMFSKHEGHVKDQLKNNRLREPIESSSLRGTFVLQKKDDIIKIKVHRLKVRSRKFEAICVTENCFNMIEYYLNDLTLQGRTFQPFHAKEVVKKVIDFVENHNSENKTFTFTSTYKVRLVVHVCRRAFQQFTKMREEYNLKHNASTKLKRMKNATFNLFNNKVRNCSNERAAADFFCDRLAELIKVKVREKTAREIFDDGCRRYSRKKYHLIIAILEDLACRDGFAAAEWGLLLTDPEAYALQWITREINNRCFGPENKDKIDSYASIAGSISRGIDKGIRSSVMVASEHTHQQPGSAESKIGKWMETFCNEAEKYLAVQKTQMVLVCNMGVVNIDNFEKLIFEQLDEAMKQITKGFQEETKDVIWEGPPPYILVMDKLWGCRAACPFCKEPCQWTNADHCKGAIKVSHRCIQHRCQGHQGMVWASGADKGHLSFETCSYSIQSKKEQFRCQNEIPTCIGGDEYHDFRKYKSYYPDWDIAPCKDMESSKFWMWVMATYNKELAKLHCAKEAKIPKSWTEITKHEALMSLRESF